ncbi:MAG TPA: anthranilate phosphoribosyltransferase [Rhizomicrobium sp.]|jgi:anthranilate phosphoribosyltransferase
MSEAAFSPILKRVVDNEPLDADTAERAFDLITSGEVSEAQIAGFLTALAMRGPSVDEIVGGARALRAKMLTIEAPDGAIDVCGTGGDGKGTLNISTAVAFVVAACGVPVAKHGNRNMSSKSGAADVLEVLGARVEMQPAAAAKILRETGVCFLFAQLYHPAVKYAAPVRRALGFRTIFNLLGPLCNPARVKRQLIGVYAGNLVVRMRDALARLATERAWVVHGTDGMDEMTTTATTLVGALDAAGTTAWRQMEPEDAGVPRARPEELKGGSARDNAAAMLRLLGGESGAYRDIVLLNSAAALIVAGKAATSKQGAQLAAQAIDSRRAKQSLEHFIAASRDAA